MQTGRGESSTLGIDNPDYLEHLAHWLGNPANSSQAASGLKAILIDEFQDVNDHIFEIIVALQESSGASLFVIGDDDQDILRSNRKSNNLSADNYFKQFCSRFELDINKQPTLTVNFRSDSRIVERSQKLLNGFFKDESSHRLKQKIKLIPRKNAASGIMNTLKVTTRPLLYRSH